MKHGENGGCGEYGAYEREIHIEAEPEIVFRVISRPEHLREWWPDEATLVPAPGAVGELRFHDGSGPDKVQPMTVVEMAPPHRFSFRWAYAPEVLPDPTNSFLVTFDLKPSGSGTILRMTETGFREQSWEEAMVEAAYRDHAASWDRFTARLAEYAAKLVASR